MIERDIRAVNQWIDAAQRIVGLTGAGISTNSGIPDYRGPQGVWTRNPDAYAKSDISFYVDDPEARKRRWASLADPARERRERPKPNEGHYAFATLAKRGKLDTLVTQNVDGLHLAAGIEPAVLVEIHGNTREVMCLSCDERAPIERAIARVRAGEADPPCRSCGGILKVAVISFGQSLIEEDLRRAQLAAANCDLLLCVGSTLGVYPAASMVPIAKRYGGVVVIVNNAPTDADDLADAILRGDISDILPELVAAG